jgi:hypothetical protein
VLGGSKRPSGMAWRGVFYHSIEFKQFTEHLRVPNEYHCTERLLNKHANPHCKSLPHSPHQATPKLFASRIHLHPKLHRAVLPGFPRPPFRRLFGIIMDIDNYPTEGEIISTRTLDEADAEPRVWVDEASELADVVARCYRVKCRRD